MILFVMKIFTKGSRKCICQICIILLLFFSCGVSSATEIKSLSVFGLSTHKDNNNGKGYEEFNYGLAIHFAEYLLSNSLSLNLQVGAFRNSFDDLAVWSGGEVNYKFNEKIIGVADFRNWQTKRNTYAARAIVVYPKLRFKIHKKASLDWLIRESGHVFSYRIDF